MTHALLVTKYIRDILTQDEALMKLLPQTRLIAVDAKLGTDFPFAVIWRNNILHKQTKDGFHEEDITIHIAVVDNNYIGSITIADEITNWLEGHTFKDENINIRRMMLISSSEEYRNDAFVQHLDFNINLQNI